MYSKIYIKCIRRCKFVVWNIRKILYGLFMWKMDLYDRNYYKTAGFYGSGVWWVFFGDNMVPIFYRKKWIGKYWQFGKGKFWQILRQLGITAVINRPPTSQKSSQIPTNPSRHDNNLNGQIFSDNLISK